MITISDRGYWITAVIVVIGVIGQWLDASLPGLMSRLWILPAACLIAAVFAERAALSAMRIDVAREAPTKVYLGERFDVEMCLSNHARRAVHIQYQPSYPDQLSADCGISRCRIARSGSVSTRHELLPLQLGETSLGDIHIKVLGFLGLVWWYRRADGTTTVRVVPRSGSANLRSIGEQLVGARFSRRPAQGGMEFLLHRGYQHGDPLQIVDWKASARSEDLVVRVMTREQRLELVLLLDCGRTSQLRAGKLSRLHHNVNIVARLAELAVQHGDRVACVTYANRPLATTPLSSGSNSLRKIRAILQDARSVATESNLLAAALQARKMMTHRALVVVLTDLSTGDSAAQFGQAVRLLSHKHRVIVASIEDVEIEALRWREASHWLDPYRSFAAAEFSRERKLTVLKLKQRGVSVITAAPEELDQRVMAYYRELRQRIAV